MGKLMERERMTWENILKQDTIEEYIRNKGYERVSDRYNGGEVTFENEGGQNYGNDESGSYAARKNSYYYGSTYSSYRTHH